MFRDHENIHLPSSSSCAPQDLNDVSHEFTMRRSMSISGPDQAEELQPDDDLLDDGCQLLGEKKRRLNLEQVKTLEKSFELGNKLEPERKVQLARALGLHPRQVAIWFQNRRARWKTKQLEKNYQVLKRQIESLKADNDALKSQNKKLQSQLLALKSRESTGFRTINLNKDNEGSWINGSDHDDMSCHVNLNTTSNKNLVVLPSSIGPGAAVLTHVLHSSSKTDHFQGHKINNEPFSNMFVGLEENQDFWPWPEQQNFH